MAKSDFRGNRSFQMRAMVVMVGVVAAFGVVMMLSLSLVVHRYAIKGVGIAKQGNCVDTTNPTFHVRP
jgi:hypothetical protein